jgi:hypothetical protein
MLGAGIHPTPFVIDTISLRDDSRFNQCGLGPLRHLEQRPFRCDRAFPRFRAGALAAGSGAGARPDGYGSVGGEGISWSIGVKRGIGL